MNTAVTQLEPTAQPPLWSALYAALAAAGIDLLYLYLMYTENPINLQKWRVQFWIAFTAGIALAAAGAWVSRRRRLRALLLGYSSGAALTAAVVALFSVGALYLLPLVCALSALRGAVHGRIELADAALATAAAALAIGTVIAGFNAFPLD